MSNKIKMGMDEKIFNIANYILLAIFACIFIYPIINFLNFNSGFDKT